LSTCSQCKMRDASHWVGPVGGDGFVCERCYARHVFESRPDVDVPRPEVEERCDNPTPWLAIALVAAVLLAAALAIAVQML